MRNLFAEYLEEKPELLAFFAGNPKSIFSTAPKPAPWAPSLVEALGAYQESLGGRHLFMGDEAVVITGQQAGLLTGPLYTIYKAATALVLAKRVHDRFGIRCVPVFWVAGDDHDFEEARVTSIITKTNEILSLRYEPKANVDALPMYRVPIEASLHNLVDQAAAQANGSELRDEIAGFLHESLDASGSFADWMARIMARLFRDTPLVIFSPHIPAARALAAEIIDREIRDPMVSTMLVNGTGQRLQELGFPQQVEKGDADCNFFVEMGGRRRKVLFENDQYLIPDENVACTIEDMAMMLRSAPERFTPNVALRCVVQQHLFPVAAYVAGPGEIAYWAQLKTLFRHFGKDMPLVYPRARCVLTDMKLNQLMLKFQFELKDIAGPTEDLMKRALQVAERAPTQEIVQRHREPIMTAVRAMVEELDGASKAASGMAKKIEERMTEELDRLDVAILKDDEAQTEAVRKQVTRLCNTLFPFRKPQERVLSIFSFLFEYGWDLIPRIVKEIDVDSFGVKEIEL